MSALFDERLRLFKKMNPDISDINRIYPGQIIRMPIVIAVDSR